MQRRGTRGAYRKEDRVALPKELQQELVEKAAAKYGNCQELAKRLNIPKSSVHYYRVGRLTVPVSVLEELLRIAADESLEQRVKKVGIGKDRTWANEYAVSVYREMCRERVTLPTKEELETNDDLRRKAAAIISYVMAEGSVWLQKEKWGECAANITFAAHETDLYDHFRSLCRDVFRYDIGPPQAPGNGAVAIRGFIYSRFVAEWLIENGVLPGEKSARELHLPKWVIESDDRCTWIAAVQPWCDGEGSVRSGRGSGRPAFTLSQSRHTDLTTDVIPDILADYSGFVTLGVLRQCSNLGLNVLGHLQSDCRSEVFDDVRTLFMRLGLDPALRIQGLKLKNDGRWSCTWILDFGVEDTAKLYIHRMVIGKRKRGQLAIASSKN